MKRFLASAVLAALVSTCTAFVAAQRTSDIDTANKLFKAGNFESAEKIYINLAGKNPKDETVLRQLGYIALLGNHLDTAQKWLERSLALKPDDANAKVMLANVFYRRDDLLKAGDILEKLGPNDQAAAADFKMLTVPKLESFRGLTAYELHGTGQSTTLKFVTYKLLPVVNVRINGGPEVTFFIDTGGAELVLDTAFAKEIGVKSMGSFQGTFSGGQNAEVLTSKVNSVTLGDWTISNVPVVMMALRQLSDAFGVKHLDGCVGTNVLYHFLATLDYRHQQLVLRRKDAESLKQLKQAAGNNLVSVPMWLAGDHYIVSMGQVNSVPPAMLFVDTGTGRCGHQVGRDDDQERRHQVRGRQSIRWGRRRRKLEDRALYG